MGNSTGLAVHPDEVVLPVDLIIIALKHHHLPEAVQSLGKLVGDSTLLVHRDIPDAASLFQLMQ
jgi:hypothetical protein